MRAKWGLEGPIARLEISKDGPSRDRGVWGVKTLASTVIRCKALCARLWLVKWPLIISQFKSRIVCLPILLASRLDFRRTIPSSNFLDALEWSSFSELKFPRWIFATTFRTFRKIQRSVPRTNHFSSFDLLSWNAKNKQWRERRFSQTVSLEIVA